MKLKDFFTRKRSITLIIVFSISIVVVLGVYIRSTQYKSNIKVNINNIDAAEIVEGKIKIGVFSDVQLLFDYQLQDLERAVSILNEQDCDIIVFNGDLINFESITDENLNNNKVIAVLNKLKPKYGKFAILGEQDVQYKKITRIFNNSGFEIIDDKIRNIYIGNNKIDIAGISLDGSPEKVIKKMPEEKFNIIFTHKPDKVDIISKYDIDLVVTSHTLGGQFLLPIYGSIYPEFREFEYYNGSHNVNDTRVYNMNGLGTFSRPVRFNAPSSVDIFIIE